MLVLLSLACDEDNNKSENGDDKSNGTPDPKSSTIPTPENLASDETSSTDGAYELSWNEVSGATTYKLREDETELELSSDDIQNRTHSVTAKGNGSYDYQVQACDASGACSDWSSALTVNVFTSDPPTLTSDETSSTDGTYELSWVAVTGATTYKLQESEGGQESYAEIYSGDADSHELMAKMSGSYSYQVRACHTNGVCSEWSSPAITVNVFRSAPPTLTSDPTSSTDGSYTLGWNVVDGAATYELQEVMSESNTPLSLTPKDLQTRTHSVTAKGNGSYEYQVRACHTNGVCSEWSSPAITVKVFSMAPTLSSDKAISRDGSYRLSWTDVNVNGATYKLQEVQEGDTGSPLYSGADRNHDISGKTDGSYRYRVRACDTSDNDLCTPWSELSVPVIINCAARPTEDATTGFNDGDGATPATAFLICTYPQLQKMRENDAALGKHYKLGKDIDASRSRSADPKRGGGTGCTAYDSAAAAGTDGHPDDPDTCTGWVPVGTTANPFTGSLQGAGYEIQNLYINLSSTSTIQRAGLFGETGSASVIQGIGITAAYIKSDRVPSNTGGLVARNTGSISNSYVTGSVTSSIFFSFIGGLVGSNSGSISNSYATASVTATASSNRSSIGGLVGYNDGGGRISNSYATGSVTGYFAGGLLGQNSGSSSISNSYATGNVTGNSNSAYAGGLTGWNTSSSSIISNSYATGIVRAPGGANTGGLVGRDQGSLSNSYATGSVPSGFATGGLVGNNTTRGSYSGKNYFVANAGGADGIGGRGSCAVCSRAGEEGQTDEERRTWLKVTLDERTPNDADPPGLGWSPMNWDNFTGTEGDGYPLLLYAEVAGYCNDGSDKNESDCKASGSCSGTSSDSSYTREETCTADGVDGTWTFNAWLAGGDECGGTTGVVCGARIGGQD